MPHKDRAIRLNYYKSYWAKHRQRYLDKKLERNFGLTREGYNRMFASQAGVCAICFKPESVVHGKSKQVQPLAVDHDHATGKVRALVCSCCNTALGLLQEDRTIVRSLLNYLERFK